MCGRPLAFRQVCPSYLGYAHFGAEPRIHWESERKRGALPHIGRQSRKTPNLDELTLVCSAEVGTIMRNPLIAGTLSLLIPGLGQIYNGRVLIGVIWMLVFGISWLGSVGFFGLIVHVISAWCAYSFAKDHPLRA